MIRHYLPKNTEELIRWYERYVAPLSLVAGFVIDNVLFRSIDLWTTVFAVALYLACAIGGMFALNFVETGRAQNTLILRVAPFFPVIVQFSFGGMFSGFFVLYSESATLVVSWISVAILALFLIGNDRFRLRYRLFSFQVGVLFVAILGFLSFLVPLVFKQIGPIVFLASSVGGTVLIALYILLMYRVMPELIQANLKKLLRSIGAIFLIFNVLYFTNAIPPLPLALKEAGVYHNVERIGDEYHILYEPAPWYRQYLPLGKIFHRAPGEPLYAFSAVFAPSGLSTTLTHEWQNYDAETEDWNTVATVEFPVVGGRDGGYRGFSITTNPRSGKWRVNVLTPYGQLVGRISFTVIEVAAPVELQEKTL